jgi:serine phosphatase RsbU (regulator of sigma subunit)
MKLVTVRNKIFISIFSIILVFSPVLFYYFPNKQKEILLESYVKEVKSVAVTVALGVNIALEEQDFAGVQTAMNHAKEDPRLSFVALVQEDTDIVTHKLNRSVFSKYPESYNFRLSQQSNDSVLLESAPLKSEMLTGKVVVGYSTRPIQAEIYQMRRTSFLVSGGLCLLMIAVAFTLASNLSKPIKRLKEATVRVAEGNLMEQVEIRTQDEIGDLGISFNYMIKKLHETENQLKSQKNIVEERNQELTDSIVYARRIQDAILPDPEIKYRLFPNSFVLYQPKDVVSGDFYWYTEKNGKKLIAAVDCTGHGVPGAFMSMIGISFLNEIVNEKGITEPGAILSELRHVVIQALKQTGAEGEQKDGMDIAMLAFDEKNMTVEFSGANNPLWHYSDGALQVTKADKRPIGFFKGKGLPFTNHKFAYRPGDTFYIFTDGFADQFGGERGKKFKYKPLQELLVSVRSSPVKAQEEIVREVFNEWKGGLEQVDDVLLICVQV